jgi:hypothetical protein
MAKTTFTDFYGTPIKTHKKTRIYYDVNNEDRFNKITQAFLEHGYKWAADRPTYNFTFKEAKSCYHGNSKLLLDAFYNSITGKNEIQVTTKSVIRTYLQYKNTKIKVLKAEEIKFC